MNRRIILEIKLVKILFFLNLVYYLIYNQLYGWNKHPINETEEVLDMIAILVLYICFGWVIGIVLDYIKYKLNTEL